MKLSILTTITNPEKRQDAWYEALKCYSDLADEVIVVNGGEPVFYNKFDLPNIKSFNLDWPYNWHYLELPRHLNYGLAHATGDWVIKLDIDQLIHEGEFGLLREQLEKINDKAVATFQKMSVYANRKYLQKGEIISGINMRAKKTTLFGLATDKNTDLCEPILVDLIKDVEGYNLPIGHAVPKELVGRTGINLWNFDYTFKDKETVQDLFYRLSMAMKKYYGTTKLGQTSEDSFKKFLTMMKSRMSECIYELEKKEELPKYIADKYWDIPQDRFGYNGWGLL